MLCSKCYKKILQGGEIQVEGTIFCKECNLVTEKANEEKVVTRCWNCNRSIRKGELIHESFRNDSKNFSKWFSVGSSERLFQCDECYQVWRNEVKKLESWPKLRYSLFGFLIGVSLYQMIKLFFPEIHKKILDNSPSVFILAILLLIIFIFFLGPTLEVNKYKFRRKSGSKKSNTHA